ncbi:MAG: Cna B-type domain-containing protein [Lachnospiraceae bacterium]
MNKRIKAILPFLLISVVLFLLPSQVRAETGSITVNVRNEAGTTAIPDFEVSLCQIAKSSGQQYDLTESLKDSGIAISDIISQNNAEYAKEMVQYIQEARLVCMSGKTDQTGRVVFRELEKGIYLVFCKEKQSYVFNPYFVFIPTMVNEIEDYDISSTPKTCRNQSGHSGGYVGGGMSITVTKIWEDNGDAAGKRPDSITVNLKRNGVVCGSATLEQETGWRHSFLGQPLDGKYSVEEEKVRHYETSYSGDVANGFIITNRYDEKKPTGQSDDKGKASQKDSGKKSDGKGDKGDKIKKTDKTKSLREPLKRLGVLPRTGDNSTPFFWLFLTGFSAVGIIVLILIFFNFFKFGIDK